MAVKGLGGSQMAVKGVGGSHMTVKGPSGSKMAVMVGCSHELDNGRSSVMAVEACQGQPQEASLKAGGRRGGGRGGEDGLSMGLPVQVLSE